MTTRMAAYSWGLVVAMSVSAGCRSGREAQCAAARRAAATAWQTYETSARERVNHLDEEATVAASAARETAARAETTAHDLVERVRLLDLAGDPPTAHPTAVDAAVDDPRARLAEVRTEALTLATDVSNAIVAAREAATAVTSRDPEAARVAAEHARDAAGHAASTSARVAAHPASGLADPVAPALAQITQAANQLVASARATADAAESAAEAADAAAEGLERANAALTASGAAFRSPAQARESARAVGDDPSSPGLAHARAETEAAWSACQGN